MLKLKDIIERINNNDSFNYEEIKKIKNRVKQISIFYTAMNIDIVGQGCGISIYYFVNIDSDISDFLDELKEKYPNIIDLDYIRIENLYHW